MFRAIVFLGLMLASTQAGYLNRQRRAASCKDVPIELGIVLDSSVSIPKPDFARAKSFLQDLVSYFDIGQDQTRVSLITYGRGVYTDQAFNLDAHSNKAELLATLGAVQHKFGDYTATGEGISYMSENQLTVAQTRPGITRVGVVITDGNSQEPKKTAKAATEAAATGIVMIAVGVGHAVKDEELLRIAVGNSTRVITARNFGALEEILAPLTEEICPPSLPTTTPEPKTAVCELSAADLYFVFSQKSLGLDLTAVTVDFIDAFISADDFDRGFRYGVISDTCDAGFDIGYYNRIDSIIERLRGYEQYTLPSLVEKLIKKDYPSTCSSDAHGRVAVIFSGSGQKTVAAIQDEVNTLVAQGVLVYLVDLSGAGVQIQGAVTISESDATVAAHTLLNLLCTA